MTERVHPMPDKWPSPRHQYDDPADRRRLHALKRRVRKAKNFPTNTCPASRHLHMIADALAARKPYWMLLEEPEHIAEAMYSVLASLWEMRTKYPATYAEKARAIQAADHYVVYKDRALQWRWTYVASNGRKIADSGEGYNNEADCLHGITLMKGSANARSTRRKPTNLLVSRLGAASAAPFLFSGRTVLTLEFHCNSNVLPMATDPDKPISFSISLPPEAIDEIEGRCHSRTGTQGCRMPPWRLRQQLRIHTERCRACCFCASHHG